MNAFFYICDGNDTNMLADALLDNKSHNKHEPKYAPEP